MTARRKFWGWGREDQTVSDEEAVLLARVFGQRFGTNLVLRPSPKAGDFDLRAPRLTPPSVLSRVCTSDPHERLVHAYGKSFPDYVRMFQRLRRRRVRCGRRVCGRDLARHDAHGQSRGNR